MEFQPPFHGVRKGAVVGGNNVHWLGRTVRGKNLFDHVVSSLHLISHPTS